MTHANPETHDRHTLQPIPLRAGPICMVFQVENAFLRSLKVGDTEVLRGIYAAVRDQDWDTVAPGIHDLQVEKSDDSFSLSFATDCGIRENGESLFTWRGTITGSSDGRVEFHFSGEAKIDFLRNRIGLCVLHPIRECAGEPCRVEHTDGTETASAFPQWISPHQPFQNMRSISHQTASGADVKVTFAGEVFEMEDQRNWTDASFKTYGTPLDLPFPVEITAGTKFEQTVTVEVTNDSSGADSPSKADVESSVIVDWQYYRPLPLVGFSLSTCGEVPTSAAIDQLRRLQPDHLRLDLWLEEHDWSDRLRDALQLAEQLDCRLEVALFLTSTASDEWKRCLEKLSQHSDRIARCLVFDPVAKATPHELVKTAATVLKKSGSSIAVALGTNAFFAELNRNRPSMPDGLQVCYSINPQVHAFDNRSLCETLEAQQATVDSAVHLFSAPIVVSPVTLRPRFNPNATSAVNSRRPEPETDERQSSGFAAAWTVGSLSQLATHPAIASLTYFETTGPRGVMTADGRPFPLARVFEVVGSAHSICQTSCQHPLTIAAAGLLDANGRRTLLLGNMSTVPQAVRITSSGKSASDGLRLSIEPESVRLLTEGDLV